MTIAVVGVGAVGRRHVANALALGCDVVLVRRSGSGNPWNLPEVRTLDEVRADVFVVATPTAHHIVDLIPLLERNVPVLCEKPVCASIAQAAQLAPLAACAGARARVVVQMRYHPLVEQARTLVADGLIGRLHSVRCSVGQYLPDWRPGRDVSDTYSANTKDGGGVVLDLIHEYDLACLFGGGPIGPVRGLAARVADVTVDTADVADLVFRGANGPLVSVHMDYLHRGLWRETLLVGAEGTLRLELARGTLEHSDARGRVVRQERVADFDRNAMFVALLQEFLASVHEGQACRLPAVAEHLALQAHLWPLCDPVVGGGCV